MSRRLPFDVERCHGHGCVFPEKCDRMVSHRDIRSLQTYYNETAESMARLL